MAYVALDAFRFDCNQCHTRCDGKSKGTYLFANDVAFSESYEQEIIARINTHPNYRAQKTTATGYPDIEISHLNGSIHRYLEVKVQQRTFMTVQNNLPNSGLLPSETIALNLSDLLRYFTIEQQTGVPTSIVWVLLNRPCINTAGQPLFYYQSSSILQQIYLRCKNNRRFRRLSGTGDVVNGQHKGVTVNYHFSLKELRLWQW